MHPITKMLIGIALIVGSVYYTFIGFPPYLEPAWSDFLVVLNGAIPPFVFLLGIFVVWLELDELRIERELRTERKARRRKRKK